MKERIKKFLEKFPPIYSLAQKCWWGYSTLMAKVFGTKIEEKRWVEKGIDEILGYWEGRNHPRRQFLVEKIGVFSPFSTILEAGCICGPNLYLLAKKFPQAKIKGIDINPLAIKIGKELFKEEGIKNVALLEGKADELSQFQDKSFDIVFTDALLIYIGPDKIGKVLKEMARISKKGLILAEWHIPEGEVEIYDPHIGVWRRNYVALLNNFFPKEKIYVSKTPSEFCPDNNWQKFGYIIEVKL